MLGYPRTVGVFLNIPANAWLALGLLASRTTGSKPNLGGAQIRFADKKTMLVGIFNERSQNYQILFRKVWALGR